MAGQVPFVRRRRVGYQPVIITLPEGANLAATAVISADRRYVRITCVPLFSGVAEVNVFNTATGSNIEGRGGTGGRGFSGWSAAAAEPAVGGGSAAVAARRHGGDGGACSGRHRSFRGLQAPTDVWQHGLESATAVRISLFV